MTVVGSRRALRSRPMALAALLDSSRGVGSVVDLALGVPPDGPSDVLTAAAADAVAGGHNQYVDAAGLPDLRRAVADHLAVTRGARPDPGREVTVTCGSTEAATATLLAVTDPGDEVLVPEPYFENHPAAVELVGAVAVPVALAQPGWRLDVDALRAAVTPRTRAILFSSPHNPTGRCFDADEMSAVLALCHEHDLVCITDETYDGYHYGPRHASPLAASGIDANAVVCGSFSKAMQVSGWRVGWCVAPPELTAGIRAAHTRLTLGAATPLQHAVLAGLRADAGVPPAALVAERRARRDQLIAGLGRLGVEVEPAEGGWFVFARIGTVGWRSDDFAHKLADQYGVLVAPGGGFFHDPSDGQAWVRLSLVRSETDTARALHAIGELAGRTPE